MMIYSFDDVLRAPKSLHSIEVTPGGKSKIPLWRPVPWIGFVYFVLVELAFVIAAKLPVTGVVSEMFAPLVYYVALPVGVVWLALYAELDGRSPHAWAISYALYMAQPKRTLAGREMVAPGTKIDYAGRVRIWWDVHAPRLHHGWITGGLVSTSLPVHFTYALLHRSRVIAPEAGGANCVGHVVEGKLQVRP